MRADVDPQTLLAAWEGAIGSAPAARAALLLGTFGLPQAAATLGERNRHLLALHGRLFGRELALLARCPQCRSAVEFSADAQALQEQLQTGDEAAEPHDLELNGHRIVFRLPRPDDVDLAGASPDEVAFALQLVERCVLRAEDGTGPVAPLRLPPAVLDALSQRMEALDPGASLSFGLDCPQCSASWEAPLDAAQLVWQKVQSAAEQLLLDVDLLARTYGWNEAEVLALGPMRRAAYLQMAAA